MVEKYESFKEGQQFINRLKKFHNAQVEKRTSVKTDNRKEIKLFLEVNKQKRRSELNLSILSSHSQKTRKNSRN